MSKLLDCPLTRKFFKRQFIIVNMLNNLAASHEAPNDRGMNSISSKCGVQYTLDEFSSISIIEDILGESFFKITYEEFLSLYRKAGIPDPNFNYDFFNMLQIDDPKLKQLVLKVEMSRFLINNMKNDTFCTGLENFVSILADFIRSFPAKGKLLVNLVNKEVVRLNLLISEGFYNECLEVDIDKINAHYITVFPDETSYDTIFERNLQIFVYMVDHTAGKNPKKPVAKRKSTFNTVGLNAVLPAVNSITQMTMDGVQSAAINFFNSNSSIIIPPPVKDNTSAACNDGKNSTTRNAPPPITSSKQMSTDDTQSVEDDYDENYPSMHNSRPIRATIFPTTVNATSGGIKSYAQAHSQQIKAPFYINNGIHFLNYDKVDMLLLHKFNQKNKFNMPLDAILDIGSLENYLESNEVERARFYNCYVVSKMNITKVHLSAGKPGAVTTESHRHNMSEWPPTKEGFIVITNLPKEFRTGNEAERKLLLSRWSNQLEIAVDVNAFLGDRWYGINTDDVGQDDTLMLVLPIMNDGNIKPRQYATYCNPERINKKFESMIGFNIIEKPCPFLTPLLFIDGLTLSEVQFMKMKIQQVLEQVLDQELIVLLHPFYVKATIEGTICHHTHMMLVVYCVHKVAFEDLYNMLNLVNKSKVQDLIVDGRIFIMAKTINEIIKNKFTKALISSIPNAYVVFNVHPSVTPELALNCVVGHAPKDIFILPSVFKTNATVDIHYIVPQDIPMGTRIIINPGILPVGPVPIVHAEINYARPNMASNGKNRVHHWKNNHFVEVVADTNRDKPTSNSKKK